MCDRPVAFTHIVKRDDDQFVIKAFDRFSKRIPNSDGEETDIEAAEATALMMRTHRSTERGAYRLECPRCGSIAFSLFAGDGRTDHPYENVQVQCLHAPCRLVFVPTYEDWYDE